MLAIDCHVHGTRVLLDWTRIEGSHDSPEGPVLDWHCYCGARGRLIAGSRSEPRELTLVVLPTPEGDGTTGDGGATEDAGADRGDLVGI